MKVRTFCAVHALPLARRTLVCSGCPINICQRDGQILPPSGGGESLQTSKAKCLCRLMGLHEAPLQRCYASTRGPFMRRRFSVFARALLSP